MKAPRGFTLVEVVISIVVLGIVASIVAAFIRMPAKAYVDSVGRAEVTDEVDQAVRRIARDLRAAVPNTIRAPTGRSVEFLLARGGGRYLAPEDDAPPGGMPLDFLNGSLTFTSVGGVPAGTRAGDFIIVNNLGESNGAPLNAWETNPSVATGGNIARVGSVVADNITLMSNPFSNQNPPLGSETHRFQVSSGPVSYACLPDGGTFSLFRFWNYPINLLHQVPPTGAGLRQARIATRLVTCNNIFRFGSQATERTGLIIITLAIRARNENDPAIQLVHQVHVDNTP